MREVSPFRILLMICLVCLAAPARANAHGPDYWQVSGVKPGHSLHIRKGPSVGFSIIGKIPAQTTGLENLGCSPELTLDEWQRLSSREQRLARAMRWCRVRYGTIKGWVAGRFLREGQGADG